MVSNLISTGFDFLMHYVVHSTVLLGLTWLYLRRNRRGNHWVHDRAWKWAALAGLVTTSFQFGSGWSPAWEIPVQVSFTDSGREAVADKQFSPHTPTDDAFAEESLQVDRHAPDVVDDDPSPATSIGPLHHHHVDGVHTGRHPLWQPQHRVESATVPPEPVLVWLGWIGLTVIVLIGLVAATRMVNRSRWWSRHLRHSERARGRSRRVLHQFLQRAGIKRGVTLYVSKDYPEPVAMGIVQWIILLPSGLDQDLSDEQLTALFAHELGHLVRRDPLWLCIGQILCSVLAVQPLNFLARKRWRAAAEFVCDDWAVKQGVSRLSLAQCLTTVAEWRLSRRRVAPPSAVLAASGNPSSLPERVERLLDDKELDHWRSPWWRSAWSIVALSMAILLAIYAPRLVGAAGERESEIAAEHDERELAGSISLQRERSTLEELDHEMNQAEQEIQQLRNLLLHSEDATIREAVEGLEERLESLKVNYRNLRKITKNLIHHE